MVEYDTAERSVVTDVPSIQLGSTLKDAESLLMRGAKYYSTVDYVYVLNKSGVLVGVMSVREILGAADKSVKVDDVMVKNPVVAHLHTHQETLVYRALKHGIKSMPIVDRSGVFIGVVPFNTILQIFNEELHGEILKLGGVYHKVGKEFATINSKTATMIRHRMPWLVVGVLGGAVTATIVGSFEDVLSRLITLAAFTPVLAYLSDAVGTQSETLAVRSIALDPKLSVRAYFARELSVALVLALTCGILLAAVAEIGWADPVLSVIVGISMFLSIIAAVMISTTLPFILRKFNVDPAYASGPFATMISDIATVTIYFLTATQLLTTNGLL
ncbi:MAG: magnesium transporter [Candidatus Altiarchaeota archaeon]